MAFSITNTIHFRVTPMTMEPPRRVEPRGDRGTPGQCGPGDTSTLTSPNLVKHGETDITMGNHHAVWMGQLFLNGSMGTLWQTNRTVENHHFSWVNQLLMAISVIPFFVWYYRKQNVWLCIKFMWLINQVMYEFPYWECIMGEHEISWEMFCQLHVTNGIACDEWRVWKWD